MENWRITNKEIYEYKIRMKTQPKKRSYSTENHNKVKQETSNRRVSLKLKTLDIKPKDHDRNNYNHCFKLYV